MKSLSLEKWMSIVSVVFGIALFSLIIFNIITYGISDTASFEF
jgi:hypothetical protein